jgi:hypothetical protein
MSIQENRALIKYNSLVLLGGILIWMVLDYIYVKNGQVQKNNIFDYFIYLFPIGFFVATWVSFRESNIAFKLFFSFAVTIFLSFVSVLFLVLFGAQFHLSIGGYL